jgi:hypothetical protein
MRPLLLLGIVCSLNAQSGLDLAVLASRAQSFADSLSNLVCSESLLQRELRYESRIRIRKDDNILVAPPPKIFQREIVSELGYALDGQPDPVWREVRKVIRVDSKNITSKEKARERLLFGLRSNRDRDRLRLLEEFTKHGLDITVTDYGLSLLSYSAPRKSLNTISPRNRTPLPNSSAPTVFSSFVSAAAIRRPPSPFSMARKSPTLPSKAGSG